MWKDEDKDVRAQLLLSVSGSVEPSEYSCDIFMIFQFLAAYDESALLCTNYTTLVLMFIKNEGVRKVLLAQNWKLTPVLCSAVQILVSSQYQINITDTSAFKS